MKIISELKRQVEKKMKELNGKCIAKIYAKLTPEIKQRFIRMVIY